jgi:aerobic carbon-monoxide dehydrogenase large subunit
LFPAAETNLVTTFGEPRDPAMFDDCEIVLTHRLTNQRLAPLPMEARAAAASGGEDGRLTLWCSNQGAQAVRDGLAGILGVETPLVRVRTPDVGGAFGAKQGAEPEYAVIAALAKIIGRPVRWAETRSENLTGMCTAAARNRSSRSVVDATAPSPRIHWRSNRIVAPTRGWVASCLC